MSPGNSLHRVHIQKELPRGRIYFALVRCRSCIRKYREQIQLAIAARTRLEQQLEAFTMQVQFSNYLSTK